MAFTEAMKVSLEPEQMQLVEQQAKATGVQPSVYGRIAILEKLNRERKEMNR